MALSQEVKKIGWSALCFSNSFCSAHVLDSGLLTEYLPLLARIRRPQGKGTFSRYGRAADAKHTVVWIPRYWRHMTRIAASVTKRSRCGGIKRKRGCMLALAGGNPHGSHIDLRLGPFLCRRKGRCERSDSTMARPWTTLNADHSYWLIELSRWPSSRRSFSSAGVNLGSSMLIVSLLSLPVKWNGT